MPRSSPSVAAAVSVLVSLLAASGCDNGGGLRACTAIGCSDALLVNLVGPKGVPAAGRYEVRVADDDGVQSCAFTLDGAGAASETSEGCRRALAEPAAGLFGVGFEPTAGAVTLTVVQDGAEVTRQTVRPVYVDQFLNGPDCGVTCQTATVRVDLR